MKKRDKTKVRRNFFRNEATYHVYRWLARSATTDNMVRDSIDEVEFQPQFEQGWSICHIACLLLGLKVMVEIVQMDEVDENSCEDSPAITEQLDEISPESADVNENSLDAEEIIDVFEVAEALLRDAGKWAPDPSSKIQFDEIRQTFSIELDKLTEPPL